MTPREEIEKYAPDLDEETREKAIAAVERASVQAPTAPFRETLRYSSLRDIAAFCEQGV